MRSSKSRSRSKTNRNRTVGNIVNRVFDSSGPEGKVRGTPQQVIEKYNQLARDAQLSNDRVAAENFQQHAEHYQRMLNEAQRETDQRREEQERQNRDRQTDRDRQGDRERQQRPERESGGGEGGQGQGQGFQGGDDQTRASQPDVIGNEDGESQSNLVETPESAGDKPKPKPKPRPRSRKPKSEAQNDAQGGDGGKDETKAAE